MWIKQKSRYQLADNVLKSVTIVPINHNLLCRKKDFFLFFDSFMPMGQTEWKSANKIKFDCFTLVKCRAHASHSFTQFAAFSCFTYANNERSHKKTVFSIFFWHNCQIRKLSLLFYTSFSWLGTGIRYTTFRKIRRCMLMHHKS